MHQCQLLSLHVFYIVPQTFLQILGNCLLLGMLKYAILLLKDVRAGHTRVLTIAILWYDRYVGQSVYCTVTMSKVTSHNLLPRFKCAQSTVYHIISSATRKD